MNAKKENYTDDATPYLCATDIPTVISESQATIIILAKVFTSFGKNNMENNRGKCHLLLSTESAEVVSMEYK